MLTERGRTWLSMFGIGGLFAAGVTVLVPTTIAVVSDITNHETAMIVETSDTRNSLRQLVAYAGEEGWADAASGKVNRNTHPAGTAEHAGYENGYKAVRTLFR